MIEDTRTPSQQITDTVTAWPGVTATDGSRGEWSLRLGRRELGHLHGDRTAHLFFPKSLWQALREEGRIEPHPVFPDREGPASRQIENQDDVDDVIALMRLSYDRAVARFGIVEAKED
jgi:hypothetical protein